MSTRTKTDPCPALPETMRLSPTEEQQCLTLVHDIDDALKPWLAREGQTFGPILQALTIALVRVAADADESIDNLKKNIGLMHKQLLRQQRHGGSA